MRGEALRPWNDSRAQQEDQGPFSFLETTQPMKSNGLLVYYHPPNFLFPSMRMFSFLCLRDLYGLPWLQTLNCISLLVLSQPIIAEAISSSPFVLGQQCSLKEYFLHSRLVSIY